MSTFIFDSYDYNKKTGLASFHYSFDDGRSFTETIELKTAKAYDTEAFDRALFLSFVLLGASYYKTFPTTAVTFQSGTIDAWQADFFSKVYQEGLSQYAYENELTRHDLATFTQTGDSIKAVDYSGTGIVALQSGGKDSLLIAALLAEKAIDFTPWYLTTSDHHPAVLDELGHQLITARRTIDHDALKKASAEGAKNGHVPVTYMVQSIALLQAILMGKGQVLVAIANEGQEPHAFINDLPVMHQWSKTWQAEQQFQEYVNRYISADLFVGSPLRRLSEVRVAELFIQHAWKKFGHQFSSCNRANYLQGANNSELHWCGECPKCANSYLLFAPFLAADDLKALFAGQDLFEKPLLTQTFKGLLAIDDVMKPFECVGETDELRWAYHQAIKNGGYGQLPFAVPESSFDYMAEYPAQDWARLF